MVIESRLIYGIFFFFKWIKLKGALRMMKIQYVELILR